MTGTYRSMQPPGTSTANNSEAYERIDESDVGSSQETSKEQLKKEFKKILKKILMNEAHCLCNLDPQSYCRYVYRTDV